MRIIIQEAQKDYSTWFSLERLERILEYKIRYFLGNKFGLIMINIFNFVCVLGAKYFM